MTDETISTKEVRALAKKEGLLDPSARGVLPRRITEWWARVDGRKIVADRHSERALGIDDDTGDTEDDVYWRQDRKLSQVYRRHILHEDGPAAIPGCEWCADMKPEHFGVVPYLDGVEYNEL